MKTKKLASYFAALLAVFLALPFSTINKAAAGPLGSMPAWCTPTSSSYTRCAGANLNLYDGGGRYQSRWAGQYHVTTSAGHWLAYCLRDDLGHPIDTSDGVLTTYVNKAGNPVKFSAAYNYVLWKWGDTSDDNIAAAVWVLGHYYAQDVTDSNNILVPDLTNPTQNSTVNSLVTSMNAEAQSKRGPWSISLSMPVPVGWGGASTPGSLTIKGAGGGVIPNVSVSLSAVGGTVTPSVVTTDNSGVANFSFDSSGSGVRVSASVIGPSSGNPLIINPPGSADQLVGTAGATSTYVRSGSAATTAYAVGDYVWIDTNKNGIQDSGEQPLANISVDLLDNSGNIIDTTTTNAQGHYVFDDLDAGTYSIQFYDIPTQYLLTTQSSSGSTVSNDSNPNPSTGVTPSFTLGPGNANIRAVAPSDGTTVATQIDPTIDAGVHLKQMDLTITKTLTTAGPFTKGQSLLYKLVGKNNGPDIAAAGWSITDVIPDGLEFESDVPQTGSDAEFSCGAVQTVTGGHSLKCTNGQPLNTGQSVDLVLKIKISENATTSQTLKNIAYISPVGGDTVETNVLVVPNFSTDPASTATNNDDSAGLVLSASTTATPGTPKTGRQGIKTPIVVTILAVATLGFMVFGRKILIPQNNKNK